MSNKIVLTGGGTMGHVTPNLALLPHLLEKGYEVHYIGTEKGVEADKLQAIKGITYHAVKSGKLRRYFDWKNFTDPFRVIAGAFQSFSVIRRLKPDVVFSKGGFVSVPVVVGAALCVILIPILLINLTLIAKSYINKDQVPSIGGRLPQIGRAHV